MREILFRGYTGRNWQYGYLIDKEAIRNFDKDGLPISTYRVIKETICQYTGLTDKNGNKIFEGDIVGCFCNTQMFQVKWCDIRGGYFLDDVVMCGGSEPAPECLGNLVDTIEVIGNIYDNPELLEK